MRILIDGDSFVKEAREIVIRAALKDRICAHFVANKKISLPKHSKNIFFYMVVTTPDAADDLIAERAVVGDLVLTRDILLAARLLELGISVMNDRGYIFNNDEIALKLSERLVMLKARESGLYQTPSERTYTKRDLNEFANRFSAWIDKKGLREKHECVMLNVC